MSHRVQLEVCIDSLESARAAVAGGADRLEVCGCLGAGGGTTPSIGLVKLLRARFPTTPLMIMIRPRAGDFCYSSDEIDIMLEDIGAFRSFGAAGVVFGALKRDGRVDVPTTERLVAAAENLDVTFHRAIDMTTDLAEAYRDVSSIAGISRVLTSGGSTRVVDGLDVLQSLPQTTLKLLPGSGVNASTAVPVIRALWSHGVRELHMSGGGWEDGQSVHRPDNGIDMGGWRVWKTDEAAVRSVRSTIDAFAALQEG